MTAQVSITRPNPTTGLIEEQANISAASTSEIFLETSQGMILETSQKDNQESGGQAQKEPYSSEQTNLRKRASPETEANNSIKKARLSDDSRKDDTTEKVVKSDTKKDLETPKPVRQKKKRKSKNKPIGCNVYIGIFAVLCGYLIRSIVAD